MEILAKLHDVPDITDSVFIIEAGAKKKGNAFL